VVATAAEAIRVTFPADVSMGDTTKIGSCHLGSEAIRIVASGDEERGGTKDTHTVQRQQAGRCLRYKFGQELVDTFGLPRATPGECLDRRLVRPET
jgi:hypothetical protein